MADKATSPTTVSKKDRDDFELHVRLLSRAGYKTAEARTIAWLRGPAGLQEMLAGVKVAS